MSPLYNSFTEQCNEFLIRSTFKERTNRINVEHGTQLNRFVAVFANYLQRIQFYHSSESAYSVTCVSLIGHVLTINAAIIIYNLVKHAAVIKVIPFTANDLIYINRSLINFNDRFWYIAAIILPELLLTDTVFDKLKF